MGCFQRAIGPYAVTGLLQFCSQFSIIKCRTALERHGGNHREQCGDASVVFRRVFALLSSDIKLRFGDDRHANITITENLQFGSQCLVAGLASQQVDAMIGVENVHLNRNPVSPFGARLEAFNLTGGHEIASPIPVSHKVRGDAIFIQQRDQITPNEHSLAVIRKRARMRLTQLHGPQGIRP